MANQNGLRMLLFLDTLLPEPAYTFVLSSSIVLHPRKSHTGRPSSPSPGFLYIAMDPASVLQVIQFSASVLSALQTISLRISHAAEFLTDIRQYTQHLHHLLVTVSQSLDNGNTSDPLPDALIGNILADLQEVQLELSKITRYFDKPSDFMVAIPESGILEPLNVESTSAKLGRTARRVKGKIVVSYKQDHITDLKKRIKDHVDILNVVCSARTL